jgi:MscS family membrane protein
MRLAHCAVTFLLAFGLTSSAWASSSPPPTGKCESVRDSVYTLLYWLQEDEIRNPASAAVCIDTSGLKQPSIDAPRIAEQFKKVLDGRGLYIVLENLPGEADFKNDDGEHSYRLFPDALGSMPYKRADDGRWLLAPEGRDAVAGLYSETFPLSMDDLLATLPDWMRSQLIGIQIWQFIAVFLLLFFALALNKIVTYSIRTYVRRLVKRIDIKWLNESISSSDRPVGGLVIALVIAVIFPLLQFPVRVNQLASLGARVLAAISAVWLAYRLIDVFTEFLAGKAAETDTKLDDQLVPMARKSLKLFVALVGGIFILQNLNVNVGSLLAGLGLGGLAFALAAKDTVANFFGSIMIFIDKPFQIGDWIIIGDLEGAVEEVGFRTTRVRTFYDSLVTVPNASVTNTRVENMGARRYRRYKTVLGLTYDARAEQIQAFCEGVRALISAIDGMRKDAYRVEFSGFGASGLDISLTCYMIAESSDEEHRTRSNLNMEILRLAEKLGVEFAFPTQTIHVASAAHPGPSAAPPPPQAKQLAEVVDGFGPDGSLGQPAGYKITEGYRPK